MPYPENAGFMVAAYIVVAVEVLAYAVSLYVRLRRASQQ
jgi:hypothetical protein